MLTFGGISSVKMGVESVTCWEVMLFLTINIRKPSDEGI